MGCTSDENHAADFTSGAWFVILLFDLGAIVEDSGFRGWDRAEQCTAERQFLSARTIGQKAELPDAHKAAGQDMQQETPDELRCFQSHDLPLIAVGVVFIFETHAAILHRHEPPIGDGDPLDLAVPSACPHRASSAAAAPDCTRPPARAVSCARSPGPAHGAAAQLRFQTDAQTVFLTARRAAAI